MGCCGCADMACSVQGAQDLPQSSLHEGTVQSCGVFGGRLREGCSQRERPPSTLICKSLSAATQLHSKLKYAFATACVHMQPVVAFVDAASIPSVSFHHRGELLEVCATASCFTQSPWEYAIKALAGIPSGRHSPQTGTSFPPVAWSLCMHPRDLQRFR